MEVTTAWESCGVLKNPPVSTGKQFQWFIGVKIMTGYERNILEMLSHSHMSM